MAPRTSRKFEAEYLGLLHNLVYAHEFSEPRRSRTKERTHSMFRPPDFKISPQDFPILLSKKVYFAGAVEELLWFLSGSQDVRDLVHVRHWWEPFANPAHQVGPIYSLAMRKGLEYVIHGLRTDPYSRRHVISNWPRDPQDLSVLGLAPCHGTAIQFFVNDLNRLEMATYQRSADVFLGLPINFVSYALLHRIVASMTGYPVGYMHYSLGDVHLYETHVKAARIQLSRARAKELRPYRLPECRVTRVESLDLLRPESFSLRYYDPCLPIEAPLAV